MNACFEDSGATRVVAGHLVRATVYALEFVINEYDAIPLSRTYDDATGLFLWK
ncbi:MAG: hypothetical protein M5R36_20730 [Deltaproteobacteria bacterium]|nr:hypothetical protein [Deltaproteobacteria bacterium]